MSINNSVLRMSHPALIDRTVGDAILYRGASSDNPWSADYDAMTGLRFAGGFNKRIYCNLASVELDEKKQKIRDLAGDFLLKRRPTMPIVEARGTFDKASVSEFTTPYKGKDVSVFLEKCTIVSVKE